MFAEQNKSGDVPAHDENSNGHSHNGKTDGSNIAQIFRCKKQSIGAKAFHKATVCYAEHQKPKDQQHLVFAKMQEDELNG